jgi:hypothetical protein
MIEGDQTGFDDTGQPVQATMPDDIESPEMELLGELEAAGATFPKGTWPLMVAIVSGWMETHCDSPRDPRLAFNRRDTTAKLLECLTAGATPLQAGQRAECLKFDLKMSDCATAVALAKKLKLTPARVSQIRSATFNALFGENHCEH